MCSSVFSKTKCTYYFIIIVICTPSIYLPQILLSHLERTDCVALIFFLTSVTKSITDTGSLVICLNSWFQFFWLTCRNGIVEFKIVLFSSSWWATLPSHTVAALFYLPTWKAMLISLTKGNHRFPITISKQWMRKREGGMQKKRKKEGTEEGKEKERIQFPQRWFLKVQSLEEHSFN